MRDVTARIRGENTEILNQHRLAGATAAKRRCIAEEHRRDLDGMIADIYEEDVDFNFVKIQLLSHLGDHIQSVVRSVRETCVVLLSDLAKIQTGHKIDHKFSQPCIL